MDLRPVPEADVQPPAIVTARHAVVVGFGALAQQHRGHGIGRGERVATLHIVPPARRSAVQVQHAQN
jgi:hypothetical protein